MNKTVNKAKYNSAGIVLLLVIFLVFGYCPLRNALSSLVRQVPRTASPKAPEYAKIIAHDDCNFAIAAQPVPPVLVGCLPENSQTINLRPLIVTDVDQPRLPIAQTDPGRIYLRNRCLLI